MIDRFGAALFFSHKDSDFLCFVSHILKKFFHYFASFAEKYPGVGVLTTVTTKTDE